MLETCFITLKFLATPENIATICVPEVIGSLKNTLANLNQLLPTTQSPSNQASLLRLTKIICTFLNEIAKVEQGAFFISRDEIGGPCDPIKVLIGTFQRSSQNTPEYVIGNLKVFTPFLKCMLWLIKLV